MRVATTLSLVLLVATKNAAAQAAPAPVLRAPRGLPSPVPGHAAFRPAVAALGRALFFDESLSIDNRTACATCHVPGHGFASVEALPPGSLGKRALRNAPTLYNRAYGRAFSWDGRAETLEQQVILPISNPNEMALPLDQAVERLRKSKRYSSRFKTLFDRAPTSTDLSVALAAYVRTLVHGDTVIDKFRDGEGSGLITREERAGQWIYESKGDCWKCHSGGNFTDEKFHNTGIGVRNGKPRPGRMGITRKPKDAGAFKTPTLRALTETGPYMHDGSLKTLEEVVEFYRRGGNSNTHLDPKLRPLSLTDTEARHLVAFLRGLSRPAKPKPQTKPAGSKPGRRK